MLLRGLGIESVTAVPFVALMWVSYAVVIGSESGIRYIIAGTCKEGHYYLIK